MGALIALDYCIRMQPEIKGLICTSPAVGELGIPPVMFRLAAILDKIWPAVVLPNGLVVRHLSRDLAFVRKTKSDPLYHTRSSPRFGMEMIRTVNFIRDHAADIQLPTYLIHGTDDKIASIEGSRHLAKTLPGELLTYKEYAGGYHELFNDLVKHEVLADLSQWITIKCEV
jgi:alpha-beta hydrolase superfamily lysophospholipase